MATCSNELSTTDDLKIETPTTLFSNDDAERLNTVCATNFPYNPILVALAKIIDADVGGVSKRPSIIYNAASSIIYILDGVDYTIDSP